MFWQYDSDLNGNIMIETSSYLMSLQDNGNTNQNTTENNTTDNTNTTNNNTTDQNTTDNTTDNNATNNNTTDNNTTDNNTTDNNTTNNTTDQNTDTNENISLKKPIRLAYVNTLTSWWPASAIAGGMGVPGYAQ